jgi:hypothetical protein
MNDADKAEINEIMSYTFDKAENDNNDGAAFLSQFIGMLTARMMSDGGEPGPLETILKELGEAYPYP